MDNNEIKLVYRKQIILHQASIKQVLWQCKLTNNVIGNHCCLRGKTKFHGVSGSHTPLIDTFLASFLEGKMYVFFCMPQNIL